MTIGLRTYILILYVIFKLYFNICHELKMNILMKNSKYLLFFLMRYSMHANISSYSWWAYSKYLLLFLMSIFQVFINIPDEHIPSIYCYSWWAYSKYLLLFLMSIFQVFAPNNDKGISSYKSWLRYSSYLVLFLMRQFQVGVNSLVLGSGMMRAVHCVPN